MTRNKKLPTVRRETIITFLEEFRERNEHGNICKYIYDTAKVHNEENPYLFGAYRTLHQAFENIMEGLNYKEHIGGLLTHTVFIEYECLRREAELINQ